MMLAIQPARLLSISRAGAEEKSVRASVIGTKIAVGVFGKRNHHRQAPHQRVTRSVNRRGKSGKVRRDLDGQL